MLETASMISLFLGFLTDSGGFEVGINELYFSSLECFNKELYSCWSYKISPSESTLTGSLFFPNKNFDFGILKELVF